MDARKKKATEVAATDAITMNAGEIKTECAGDAAPTEETPPVVDEPDPAPLDKVHLCSTCSHEYPTCEGAPTFGYDDGGAPTDDNVTKCDRYTLDAATDLMVDASSSIPETQEAFNVDLPMSDVFMHPVPVFLTDVELGCYSKQQAELWTQWGRLNQQKKDSAKVYKEKIDKVEAELDEITRIVEEGSTERPVECRWLFDFQHGVKKLFRVSNNSVVKEETMTTEEMEKHCRPGLFDHVEESVAAVEECFGYTDEEEKPAGEENLFAEDSVSDPASTTVEENDHIVDVNEMVSCNLETCHAFDAKADGCCRVYPVDRIAECRKRSGEMEPADQDRKCCFPRDRDYIMQDNIRILYCRECGLVCKKEDTSVDPWVNIPFVVGERMEVAK